MAGISGNGENQRQGKNEEDVQKDRRSSGGGKSIEGVKQAAEQGDQGHEEQIGKSDPSQIDA